MKMFLPEKEDRVRVLVFLRKYFDTEKALYFDRAIRELCAQFKVKQPKIEFYDSLGEKAGLTFENGIIHLVHPADWKKNRKYKTQARWVDTALHEFAHYLFWTDAEKKADLFSHRYRRIQRL